MGGSFRQWQAPSTEVSWLPANRVRVITRGAEPRQPVAWLWEGWCWPVSGERIDLMARYAAGARIDELAALVTARRPKRQAPPLPTGL